MKYDDTVAVFVSFHNSLCRFFHDCISPIKLGRLLPPLLVSIPCQPRASLLAGGHNVIETVQYRSWFSSAAQSPRSCSLRNRAAELVLAVCSILEACSSTQASDRFLSCIPARHPRPPRPNGRIGSSRGHIHDHRAGDNKALFVLVKLCDRHPWRCFEQLCATSQCLYISYLSSSAVST